MAATYVPAARGAAATVERPAWAHSSRRDTAYLDVARIVAILAVVAIHAAAPLIAGGARVGTGAWWVGTVVESVTRWSVPVFIMVSGALLLDPGRGGSLRSFYARRVRRVGIPLVVWTVVYLAFRHLWMGQPVTAHGMGRDVLSGTPFGHLYFLYLILGLYLVTPFLRVLVRHADPGELTAAIVVAFGFGVANEALTTWAGLGGYNAVNWFWPYLGFYLAGYRLRGIVVQGGARRAALAGLIGLSGLGIVGTWLLAGHGLSINQQRYFWDYLNPLVVVGSLLAFLLLRAAFAPWRRAAAAATRPQVLWLAEASFGVYLIHPIVLNLWQAVAGVPHTALGAAVGVTVAVTIAVLASLLATAVLRALPWARAVV